MMDECANSAVVALDENECISSDAELPEKIAIFGKTRRTVRDS
jgi:hypothetical protein